MNITQSLQKWGNSTAIRIPKRVVDAANIHVNQQVVVTLRGNSIILTPVAEKKKKTLESMLEGVTPQAVGGEFDWGEDIGVERYE